MFGRKQGAGTLFRLPPKLRSEGSGIVACASAMPILVLALAVGTDYARVSHFRSSVQHAADAASLAAADAVARQPDADGGDSLASEVAGVVFTERAPHGAGAPNVALKSSPFAVTATVGYAGFAPSNFGSAFGYDAVSADASAISPAKVADSRPSEAR